MATVVAAVFVFVAMLAMASPARAANIVVTSNADSGAGTLRAAVATADGNTEADTITFDLPAGSRTITLASQISINAATPFGTTAYNTTVDGTGQSVTVSGGNRSRVFHVRGNLTVKRLTVSDGNRTTAVAGCCDTEGGGIYVQAPGNLAVIESTVSGNTAVRGGGIFSVARSDGTSPTTIENSTISGNTATSAGGGIFNGRGRTTITSSTITQNYASSLWGSGGGGAGVASAGDTATETVVANSIISDNSSNCSEASACTFRHDGDVDFRSNSQTPHNSFTSQGYNIIGDSSRQFDPALGTGQAIDAFNKTGDQRGVTDPKLGPLQDNGGLSQTHALLTGSPAIDKGSTTLATDQRGVSRPQGAADDVGAFELEIAVNDAPVATDDTADTDEDTAKDISVLGNDTDVNGDSLSVSSVGSAGHGTVTNNNDGTINYTPNANYNGPDSFSYTVSDGNGGTDTADVSITVTAVNDAPDAVNDSATTAEDTATDIIVLTNDTDVEGDSLSVSGSSQGTNGTVSENDDGTIKYTPNANYNGSDSFTYTVSDGNGGTDTATVNLTVNGVNDAPVAVADANSVAEDQSLSATAPGVLDNDEDVDSSSLKAVLVDDVDSGELTLNTDGSYTYTPDANFNGEDSFTYKANDGSLESNEVTVTITLTAVNDAPVAAIDEKTTPEDTPVYIDVLSNDTEGAANEGSQTLYVKSVADPANGTAQIVTEDGPNKGKILYTPDENYHGSDTFTYEVCDDGTPEQCTTKDATVNVTVSAVNDAPTANAQTVTTNEDTSKEITLSGNDVDGDNLSYSVVSGPTHGTLSGTGANLTYTPDENYNGSDSFTYKANDGSLDSDPATVNITVTAVNDAPVAKDDSYSTNEDTQLNITAPGVLGNDTDVDSASLTAAKVLNSGPAHGTLTLNADGSFTYTPDANFNGSDSFTYKASDGSLASSTATVNITVTAVNDAPTVTLASGGSCSTGTTGVSGTMNLALADVDSSGVLTLSATSSNQALVPVANIKFGGSGADRTVGITPAAKKSGSATITITASDGTATSTTTIRVIVGSDKKETITGTIGADMIFGRNGDDTINAGAGNDLVCGGNGGGVINGGAGDDTLDGGNGNDTLRGDDGNDILRGGQGNDRLEGGNNDDTLTGGTGTDGFDGGTGTDVATDYNAAEGDTRTNIP